MPIRIYNSMTRRKEDFAPLKEGKISFYLCGPTVYDYFHIGNARCWVIFDVIRRYLESRGNDVTYIVNLTDVDDKIIARAHESGQTAEELAEFFIEAFFADCDSLGIRRASHYPRATQHIPQMIDLITSLINKGHAYAVDRDVFFAVGSFPDYGRLSNKKLEDLVAGHRVAVDSRKKSPADFALWKAAKPGEPFWESPWGQGRPGWHIECSAMSMEYLGKTFDIHAGAEDLIFPHHENEIAQSRCGADAAFARYWMHLKFLNFDKQKMSKALGNVYTVREVLKEISAQALRYFFLQEHYRKPMEMASETFWQILKGAQSAVDRLGRTYQNLSRYLERAGFAENQGDITGFVGEKAAAIERAMDDDFNSAGALGSLFELSKWVNEHLEADNDPPLEQLMMAKQVFEDIDRYMGILPVRSESAETAGLEQVAALIRELVSQWPEEPGVAPLQPLLAEQDAALPSLMEGLLSLRQELRRRKDWAKTDYLRDRLQEFGFVLEDGSGSTRWRRI